MTQYLVAIHHPDDYLNSAVIPGEILEMKLRKIDEWATKKNSIYREVWLLQGNEISPVFVRTIYAMDLRRLIDQRGGVAAHEAESLARQTGEAKQISEARIQSFMLKVMRLQSKWRRKIEIEASELELAEHSVRGTPTAEQQAKSKKGRPPDKLSTSRRQVIQKVAKTGKTGEAYCQALDAYLSTPVKWQKNENGPKRYLEACRHPDPDERKKWRDRIADEKYKAEKRKATPKLSTRQKSHSHEASNS